MSDPQVPTPALTLPWENVQAAAAEMFDVWVDGRELEWAELAWKGLTTAGLTVYRNRLEKARVGIRLMVLATFYIEFCSRAWDESREPDYDAWCNALDISPFTLGQLVGPEFELDDDESTVLREDAVRTAVGEEADRVARALRRYFGSAAGVFVSLWLTATQDPTEKEDDWDDESDYENDDEEFSEEQADQGVEDATERSLAELLSSADVQSLVLGTDLTVGKLTAYEWVESGMPL